MNKKIYISGAIAHYDLDERKAVFKAAEERLRAGGYRPINPFNNGLPQPGDWRKHMMLEAEYDAMCRQMEQVAGYDERRRRQYDFLRKARSGVLHQMQLYGIDTTDWNRVNAFCQDSRIAGKQFRELDTDELNALNTKLRMIIRKKQNQ